MECESPRKASITKQRQKIPQGFMIDKKQYGILPDSL